MKTRMKIPGCVGIFCVLMLCFPTLIFAQARKNVPSPWKPESEWITYLSPFATFSIRVSEHLEYERSTLKNASTTFGVNELAFSKCAKSIDYYYLRSQFKGDRDRLILRDIDVSACREKSEDLIQSESAFVTSIIGNAKIHSDRIGNLLGLYSRDILFESGKYYPGTKDSPIYNKLRLVNAGGRLLILIYYREEGTVSEETSLFQFFRPRLCIE